LGINGAQDPWLAAVTHTLLGSIVATRDDNERIANCLCRAQESAQLQLATAVIDRDRFSQWKADETMRQLICAGSGRPTPNG